MNRDEIKSILPHREPMLLIDEIEKTENGATGCYHVRGDEWFLQGHFPNNPIVPGVIQCEMAAQTCAALIMDGAAGKTPLYTGLDKVRFRRQVKPGETIVFKIEVIKVKPPFWFVRAEGSVDGETTMSGELSFALI